MKAKVDISNLPKVVNPGRICILKSKWHLQHVQSMADACREVLEDAGYSQIDEYTLPGCLEIPLAARDLLAREVEDGEVEKNKIDAIVCFGIIVKGDTLHFEMISEESMRGLGSVMHDFRRPILVEILPVFDMQQAIDRSSDDEFNKGIEAAVAAIEVVSWRRSIGC
jgi:6,7-dimethyl-8-ribityllumazine synthase